MTKSSRTVYVWNIHGRPTRLLTAPGGEGAYNFAARGDWVSANLGSTGTVVRWNVRTGEMTDTGIPAPANGVNARGWVLAGDSVQRDDATVELVTPDGLTGTPVDISNTGVVVGSLYDYGTSGATAAPHPSGSPGSSASEVLRWQCDR